MGNYYTDFVAKVVSPPVTGTKFQASAFNSRMDELDKAITYHKGAFIGCDGVLSWSAGTLTWSGTLHIYFNRADGQAIHNEVAAGNISLADGEFAYIDLSETNNQVVTIQKAAISTGAASNFKAYNRLLLGYRNTADDNFYPEELAGVFAQMLAGGTYVERATLDAHTILYAVSDNTPAALSVGTNTVVARAAGNIEALSVAEATVVGRNTGGNVDDLSMATLRTMLENLDGREQAITCADSVTIDWSAGATARMTFDRASVALTLSNGSNGKVYRLLLKQDATGGRVVTWSTTVKWRGGSAPTLSAGANAEDILTFVYINGAWYGDIAANFA